MRGILVEQQARMKAKNDKVAALSSQQRKAEEAAKAEARRKMKDNLLISLAQKCASIGKLIKLFPKGFEEGVFFIMQAADKDKNVKKVVEAWQDLGCPTNDDSIFDQLCLKNRVRQDWVVKGICAAAKEYTGLMAFALADTAMPAIVQKSIKVAKTSKGIEDRRMLMQATNVLPTRAGIQITNMNSQRISEERTDNTQVNISLPSFEQDTTASCDEMRNPQPLLGKGE